MRSLLMIFLKSLVFNGSIDSGRFKMNTLVEKDCIPCRGDVPPLDDDIKLELKEKIHRDWVFTHEKKRLEREFSVKDFSVPMKIAGEIGKIADEQWHHPELVIGFGKLVVRIWTHKIDNLVESDFIFAAKIDQLIENYEIK